MDPEVIELKVDMAKVLEQLKAVTKTLEAQDRMIEDQGKKIATLISLADHGRGSVWMLITVGGFIGALITNVKTILQHFAR